MTFRLDVKNSCLATAAPNQSNAHWFLMFVFLGFDMGHHKYINTVAVDRSDALLLAYVLIFGTWLFAGAGVAQEFCVCCGEQREDEARPRLMAVVGGGDCGLQARLVCGRRAPVSSSTASTSGTRNFSP